MPARFPFKLGIRLLVCCLIFQTVSAEPPPASRKLTSDGLYKQRPAWSPVGSQVCYARHEGSKILLWLLDLKTNKSQRITSREMPEYDASWSPDGKQLVFSCVAFAGGQGNVDLCTISIEKPESKHLLGDSGKLSHEESPAWSPDGKQIALTSTRDGNQEVYVIDRDGQNLKRITSDPGLDAHPAWTPDGRHLLFATNRWGDFEIARVDVQGENVERLTHSRGLDDYPACSPDGEWIAFLSNRTGQYDVFVMPRANGEARNVSQDPGIDNFPAWTRQGDLSWVSNRDGGFEIYLLPTSEWKARL